MCLYKSETHVANYCTYTTFKLKEMNVDPNKTIRGLHCHAILTQEKIYLKTI